MATLFNSVVEQICEHTIKHFVEVSEGGTVSNRNLFTELVDKVTFLSARDFSAHKDRLPSAAAKVGGCRY